ncbi:MAG: FtsX-like permease family protein, partial [Pseudomonadales bacterium]|nr:FtsX-like permease family protein [Pseudomonadales bacterium]
GPLPRMKRFEVAGIFEVGADADRSLVLMHLDDAMKLKRIRRVEGIRVQLQDLFSAPTVIRELGTMMERNDLFAVSWMRRHGNLYDAIQMQKSTMFLLLLLLIAVAAFNVISNLILTVKDKRSDIAILRTLGASPREIMSVFVLHGGLVGTAGVALGLLFGVTIAVYVGEIYGFVEGRLGLGLMGEYFIHYLPSRVLVGDVLFVGLISMAICLLVTIYPAFRASREIPVEALQYDG